MADDLIQQPTQAPSTPKYGVLIGAGIVLVVLILGGLFLWGKSVTPTQELNVEDAQPTFEVTTSHVEEPNLELDELPPTSDQPVIDESGAENTFQ